MLALAARVAASTEEVCPSQVTYDFLSSIRFEDNFATQILLKTSTFKAYYSQMF